LHETATEEALHSAAAAAAAQNVGEK